MSMRRWGPKWKSRLRLYMLFSKLQLVCTWALITGREVCPHLLQTVSSEKLNSKNSLLLDLTNLRSNKYPIFRSPPTSNKQPTQAAEWPQQINRSALSWYRILDGGWSEVSFCRASKIRVFPKNAVKARKVLTTERKMSSLCTSFVNSAEQNSSLDASWVSSFVKLHFAAISLLFPFGNQKRMLQAGFSFELSLLPF